MKAQIILLSIVLYAALDIYCQGCADAGVCAFGSIKDSESKADIFRIKLIPSFALGNNLTFIQTTHLDAELFYSSRSYFQIKWQYSFISGNLAEVSGIGDIIIGFNQNIFENSDFKLDFAAAYRLAANIANKEIDGKPLPMVYQTSSGTNDLLFGISLLKDDWHFSIAYQHPFNKNGNKFNKSIWLGSKDADEYPESEKLDRGDDLVIRLGRYFRTENFDYYVSLLPIIRLEKSTIRTNDISKIVEDSSGLTFNINGSAAYSISELFDCGVDIGFPIYSIKMHPDGLLRTFVIALFLVHKI